MAYVALAGGRILLRGGRLERLRLTDVSPGETECYKSIVTDRDELEDASCGRKFT